MLITCPNCSARYLVADNVIGPSGRRVRCASCKHVWQQGPAAEDSRRDLVGVAAAAPASPSAPPPVPPTSFYPREGEAPPASEPVTAPTESDASPRFQRQPVRPGNFDFDRARARAAVMAQDISRVTTRQRNPRKLSVYLTLLIVPLALLAIGYAYIEPIKILMKRYGISSASFGAAAKADIDPDLVAGLRIFYQRPTPVDRNGTRVLPITGTITNPTEAVVPVPRMVGRLLDAEGKEVYSWSFPSPVESLSSGQTISFETLAEKVPATAANLNIAFDTGAGS